MPADREAGAAPWGSTRHVTGHDRFDRTLGIPERDVSMWPLEMLPLAGVDKAARARAICDDLLAERPPQVSWPNPRRAVALLEEVADVVYGRHLDTQRAQIVGAARRHQIDPEVAVELASGVGALIAQTTHRRPADVAGAPRFNTLAGSHLPEALRLFLARDHVRVAQAHSDPDLPRMWMLANGIAHGTPPSVMRSVPARSVGPAAKIIALHDDLIDWWGMRVAVQHMRATVTAAVRGQRWLDHIPALHTLADAALAAGVVALTQPPAAVELVRSGLSHLGIERARAAAGPEPAEVLDLSDRALKAMCDRNGWLLGSPTERTQRELVQRGVPADAGVQLRQQIGHGDVRDALERIVVAGTLDDATLDRRAYRKNPRATDVTATQALLASASAEALARFADSPPNREPPTPRRSHTDFRPGSVGGRSPRPNPHAFSI